MSMIPQNWTYSYTCLLITSVSKYFLDFSYTVDIEGRQDQDILRYLYNGMGGP